MTVLTAHRSSTVWASLPRPPASHAAAQQSSQQSSQQSFSFDIATEPEPWLTFLDDQLASIAARVAELAATDGDPEEASSRSPLVASSDPEYLIASASGPAFLPARAHICQVLRQFLVAPYPAREAANAAIAINAGYDDLLVPQDPVRGLVELKTGRMMNGYLWALWTTMMELVECGADTVLVRLVCELKKLPPRSFNRWGENPSADQVAGLLENKEGAREVVVWTDLPRIEEVINIGWLYSYVVPGHEGLVERLIRRVKFTGALFAYGVWTDWAGAADALDDLLDREYLAGGRGTSSRAASMVPAKPGPEAVCNVLAACAFLGEAGADMFRACRREEDGLDMGRWEGWMASLDETAAFDPAVGTTASMCARLLRVQGLAKEERMTGSCIE